MLRISKLADYGTVMMVYLARRAPTLCNARDIAQHTHIAVPTVSKLLKRLTAAGLLTSVRGVSGGYRLKLAASEISVGQIISALEERLGLTECSLQQNVCSLQSVCHIQGNWQLISQAIEAALDSVSLEVLAKPTLPAVELDRIRQLASGVSHG
ncbi:SUF system Fe-S cluster assembly regulator [Legionella taurinensis]|uniref:SUF system Fe-S cluster assembly regulator n=1 Tax=Legionella taurinensis TaxID=70611 RepID=A0A3A5L5D4_9GAMM|nr:SUF system Fe-S cluster assembly regulator [Legionella taurinensis]MDX1837429.1 SUF system Fe-S cluster assembly regulator [Legionella taurinensis]PUT40775.1 SUF system Fe-S cluster assembly regulator [Legionella taurinensis]PUT44197.1 SUF system Fe-S cluster assembly regulator [Legionella taurinensis]PUT47498.1 SUF system Fe-S cluster assembly regulator [Legionella taurinensis]PUT48637.1 SUF system Fe-S cluster assembly regulator [Legionella taurinensis]